MVTFLRIFQRIVPAPGFYTGHGIKTIPGVREAIERKRWAEADGQIKRAASALEHEVDLLKQATKLLASGSSKQCTRSCAGHAGV